jgi:hypothetical protein
MVAAMKSRLALTLVLAGGLATAAACQSGNSAPASGGAGAMQRDLDKICNAKKLSGADQDSSGQGTYMMAQWLNANITSDEGRAFLVEFAKLGQDKDARRKHLQTAATRYGVASCPLVDDWR